MPSAGLGQENTLSQIVIRVLNIFVHYPSLYLDVCNAYCRFVTTPNYILQNGIVHNRTNIFIQRIVSR